MPLKVRPTGLGHGVYKDHADYLILWKAWAKLEEVY
jgi:hypothetical protein